MNVVPQPNSKLRRLCSYSMDANDAQTLPIGTGSGHEIQL